MARNANSFTDFMGEFNGEMQQLATDYRQCRQAAAERLRTAATPPPAQRPEPLPSPSNQPEPVLVASAAPGGFNVGVGRAYEQGNSIQLQFPWALEFGRSFPFNSLSFESPPIPKLLGAKFIIETALSGLLNVGSAGDLPAGTHGVAASARAELEVKAGLKWGGDVSAIKLEFTVTANTKAALSFTRTFQIQITPSSASISAPLEIDLKVALDFKAEFVMKLQMVDISTFDFRRFNYELKVDYTLPAFEVSVAKLTWTAVNIRYQVGQRLPQVTLNPTRPNYTFNENAWSEIGNQISTNILSRLRRLVEGIGGAGAAVLRPVVSFIEGRIR